MKNNILIVKDWKIKHKKDIKPSDKDIAEWISESIRVELKDTKDLITDGYSYWSKTCVMCGQKTMEIVRVGKVQCVNCG